MEKTIIREDYAPKPFLESTVSLKLAEPLQKTLCQPKEINFSVILEKIENLSDKIDTFTKKLEIISEIQKEDKQEIQQLKKEYISALQCEMEINRQYLLREIRRMHTDGSIKGHGDPLFY